MSARQATLIAALAATWIAVLPAPQAGAEGSTGGTSTGPPPVATTTLQLIDRSRLAKPRHLSPVPRRLPTVLLYPAPPESGPLPLVVFAHGFADTPASYHRLLNAWAQAGFVVAAPVFPLENAHAPGGPDESDLINEPTDISFVITRLLAESAAASGPLHGLIDPSRIAVAGQSDGGEAALAVADARRYRDPRIRAAVILSGAELSGIGGYEFTAAGPSLLAVQGTADRSNEPRYTYSYFRAARGPKYLLRLPRAGHLAPYVSQQPQLGIVERVSVAFLADYLGLAAADIAQLPGLGDIPGTAELMSEL